ncbi:MAG: hypothetical protein IJ542_01085 [Clostridia bacterium]|nr:hypothetical protein [Clostridia bacterium]
MADLDFAEKIRELDKQYDFVNECWGKEVADLIGTGIDVNSKKYEKELKKINKKYADLASDILLIRDEYYEKLVKQRTEEMEQEFQEPEEKKKKKGELDENGRPIGKKWVNGEWVDVDIKD